MFSIVALMLLSQQPMLPNWDGLASYYTVESSSTLTASGETFDDAKLTCAMRTGTFGTYYRVTAENGRSVIVKLNDRGPYIKGRLIDLSEAAMKRLDPEMSKGVMQVTVERIPESQLNL